VSASERLRIAEAVRAACVEAARSAFEEGGYAGLCVEGRLELALDAIATVALPPLIAAAEREPGRDA